MAFNMMKRSILLVVLTFFLLSPHANTQPLNSKTPIVGSGASFPFQIYSIWFMLFNRDNKDVEVSYTAKGSGGGIRDFLAHAVDFAASDAAMNDEEISKVPEGVQLLPMTAGEVVLAYNLPGINELRLSRKVYTDIFLGNVKKWNNPAIAHANPNILLPDLDITVVTRADSSGTTYVFTKHLCAISQLFKRGPGYGKKVKWPEELNRLESRINAGVASTIKLTPGAIGYIDFGFAQLTKLQMASLENREGHFIPPGLEGGQAALAETQIPDDMIVWLPDPQGDNSYPITTFTWMVFYKKYDDPKKAEAIRRMIAYYLDFGQKLSYKFGYIPLPRSVVQKVKTASANIQ